jgi:hypothetical protein
VAPLTHYCASRAFYLDGTCANDCRTSTMMIKAVAILSRVAKLRYMEPEDSSTDSRSARTRTPAAFKQVDDALTRFKDSLPRERTTVDGTGRIDPDTGALVSCSRSPRVLIGAGRRAQTHYAHEAIYHLHSGDVPVRREFVRSGKHGGAHDRETARGDHAPAQEPRAMLRRPPHLCVQVSRPRE